MAFPFEAIEAIETVNSINSFSSRYRSGYRLKRSLDICSALGALLLFSPLFLLLMAMVKLLDGGDVFYGHKRVGRFGREFHCLKFRTMVPDGDAVLNRYLAANPAARKKWQETRKLQKDPRVTAVGAVLRKLSLDEMPQLFNILIGDMSIVGPRPVVREELAYYGPHAPVYLLSTPGLTGLWQISGRNDVSYDARVAFDRQYVENWSFGFDLKIIAKTVPAVWCSKGSY